MYNSGLKNKFIASRNFADANNETFEFFFDRLEPIEEENGKDLCEFSLEEAVSAIIKTSGTRVASKNANLYRLKAYIRWCKENGIKIDQRIDNLNVVDWGISGVKNRMVANPKGLQAFLDSIFEKEEYETVDNTFRCYYWMGFMGVNEKDTILIRASDVNFTTNKLSYNGIEYPLYKESLAAFKNCVELEAMILKNPNFDDVIKWRADGDILIRGFSVPKAVGSIRSAVSRKLQTRLTENDVILSYQRARLSGIFYRARHWEIDNAEVPNFVDIVKENLNDNENDASTRKRITRIAKGYLSDYEVWKRAFDI